MKKQILFLSFLVLAVLAGVTNSYGQYTSNLSSALTGCPNANPVQCLTSDALSPLAGTEYTYAITVPTPVVADPDNLKYQWIVTQETSFINGSGGLNTTNAKVVDDAFILAAGSELNTTVSGNEGKDVKITWKSFTYDPSAPVFVVIYVQNTEVCTTDNIQIYKIEPQNAFTLDLANIDNAGVQQATGFETCVHPVVSATYDAVSGDILMDYGTNYLYFAVTAANWTGAWDPSILLQGALLPTGTDTRTIEVHWAYPSEAVTGTWYALGTETAYTGTFGSANGTVYTGSTKVEVQDPSGSVGATGECIIVRVTVDNNKDEMITDLGLTLAVDGKTYYEGTTAGVYDVAGLDDIHYLSTDTDCGQADEFKYDNTTQVITQRPEIIDNTPVGSPAAVPTPPATSFIDKN